LANNPKAGSQNSRIDKENRYSTGVSASFESLSP
jgi:hypothetical protein